MPGPGLRVPRRTQRDPDGLTPEAHTSLARVRLARGKKLRQKGLILSPTSPTQRLRMSSQATVSWVPPQAARPKTGDGDGGSHSRPNQARRRWPPTPADWITFPPNPGPFLTAPYTVKLLPTFTESRL